MSIYTLPYFCWRKLKGPEHLGASACAFLYFGYTLYLLYFILF
ncbi:hypothetical protein [Pontibacter flavimaris]|nr:hypothetical protein [Pontibacter flavimaris]